MTKVDTFFVGELCILLVTLNLLLVPSSSIVVSCWAMMSIVVVSSLLLDVTTFDTTTPSRFGTIEVGEVKLPQHHYCFEIVFIIIIVYYLQVEDFAFWCDEYTSKLSLQQ